jgi:hypothetical protein
MNNDLEFAKCQCGHPTPIRPSRLALQEGDQKWIKKDDPLVVVACSECKRVYSFETQKLEEHPSEYGLSPYNPEAPMHAFPMHIPCAQASCRRPLPVIAVRKRDTKPEVLQAETDYWWWEGLTCPSGHAIPDRKKAQR